MKFLLYFLPVFALLALAGEPNVLPVVDADTPVYEVLRALGAPCRCSADEDWFRFQPASATLDSWCVDASGALRL